MVSFPSAPVVVDLAAGRSDDVVVLGPHTMTRFDATGARIGEQPGAFSSPGSGVGSNVVIDGQDAVDLAMFTCTQNGSAMSATAKLTFTKTNRCMTSFTAASEEEMTSTFGCLSGLFAGLGADATGNVATLLYPLTWLTHPRAIYTWPTGSASIGTVTISDLSSLGAANNLFTVAPNGDFLVEQLHLSADGLDVGCGPISAPGSGGAMVVMRLAPTGACLWSKPLVRPAAAVSAWKMAADADGAIGLAVTYAGTIDFGGGPLGSAGTSSLALARFDAAGNLLWQKNLAAPGASFSLASLHASNGTLLVNSGYTGPVDLGAGPLPAGKDTFIASFADCGLRWSKAVQVGSGGHLLTAAGACGAFAATDSPTVDLGAGSMAGATSIGIAALGL